MRFVAAEVLVQRTPGRRQVKRLTAGNALDEHHGIRDTALRTDDQSFQIASLVRIGACKLADPLVMGKLLRWGSGPDHLTTPLMIPPLVTDVTRYSLLWPAARPAPVNSMPTAIANMVVLDILTQLVQILESLVTYSK